MENNNLQALMASQQTELDAVLMYRKLASLANSETEKALFLGMAADEGRHGAILKSITGAELTPKDTLAKLAGTLYKTGGRRLLLAFMSRFEIESFFIYQDYFAQFPQIAAIASDEIRHGHLLAGLK